MRLHKITPIYALCDFQSLENHNLSLESYINICKNYNIRYIQYRDKINSLNIQKQNLQKLKNLTNIPIIINDKLELLDFCDGLHFGQEDLDSLLDKFNLKDKKLLIKLFKTKYPNKIFGLSTHNEVEILEANNLDLDYIGLGAYRNTATKDVNTIVGNNMSYLAKISKHPVGAIGGVKVNDIIENVTYNVIGSDLIKNAN